MILLSAAMALASCGTDDGPTVIDGSSQQAFETTLAAARRDVGARDRLKLEAAIREHQARMFAKADDRQEYQRLVREGMDGLTAPAIVAQFDKDVDRVSGQAADAVFDAKRALKGL
ncbi:hypothetical protein [Sphingobium bisphenolivorans]|uniref:hypothetical protein n=1 Tax=Sphingobium bisphenolivorans TaxID=1335760 RepID=UPI0012699963|nr:hypothetical protein [Sphingobium bisphenolivorans]